MGGIFPRPGSLMQTTGMVRTRRSPDADITRAGRSACASRNFHTRRSALLTKAKQACNLRNMGLLELVRQFPDLL